MPVKIEKEYTVHLDDKNRFAIRGAKTKHWSVKVLQDGHLLISPQKLVDDPPLSEGILRQIEESIYHASALANSTKSSRWSNRSKI
jgi:hypothetical protein